MESIRSVIIRVITKSDDRAAGVRFVYHEYDYRLNLAMESTIFFLEIVTFDINNTFKAWSLSTVTIC